MNIIELTSKLISFPSYLDENNNEVKLGNFIVDYLQSLGTLQVETQPVGDGRFNIIAHDEHPPRLMFCCHMDTVPASGEWKHDPFGGQVDGDRLYGLGACDMKGGMGALLYALQSLKDTRGLYLLFDVDEEYYFNGMLKFLEDFHVNPKLAIFPEPGLDIGNGHRGLIEISFNVRGITAHASRQDLGKNSILGVSRAVEHLLRTLENYQHPILGQSVCNLAWLQGGIDKGGEIGCQPNKIPDLAEVILDIRPASSELRAQTVIDILEDHLHSNGFQIEKVKTKIDYGSLYVPPEQLTPFEKVVQNVLGKAEYADISKGGYGEGQLLNEKFGTSCVYFGPGPKTMAHQVDEYVSIKELNQTSEVFKKIIQEYCSQG